MSSQQVNRELLLHKISHSRELTAIEKLYLEQLVKREGRTGMWQSFYREHGIVYYTCSACGKTAIRKYTCCPNCGRYMSGGEVS